MKNPVIHFELPTEDRERMADFYSKAFGWESKPMGEDFGNYTVVTTTESDKDGRPKTPGTINGGFFQKTKENQLPSVVIGVDDINEAMRKVKEAGGTVLGGVSPNKKSPEEPDDIPGVGLYVLIVDTEGNRVGVLQPSREEAK